MSWFKFKVKWFDYHKILTSYGIAAGYTYKEVMENIIKDFEEDNILDVEISVIDNTGDQTFNISREVYGILDEEVPFYDENEQEINYNEEKI